MRSMESFTLSTAHFKGVDEMQGYPLLLINSRLTDEM